MAKEPWVEFFKEHPAPIYNCWSAAVTEKYHKWLIAQGWHKDEADAMLRSEVVDKFFEAMKAAEVNSEYFSPRELVRQAVGWLDGKGWHKDEPPKPKPEPEPNTWLKRFNDWLKAEGLLKGDA